MLLFYSSDITPINVADIKKSTIFTNNFTDYVMLIVSLYLFINLHSEWWDMAMIEILSI